jgi:hypothetical protein
VNVHRSDVEKANLLGAGLVEAAPEIVNQIVEEFCKRFEIHFRDRTQLAQFFIEILVFYMHFIDRTALAELGSVRRESFGDHFVNSVVRELLRGASEITSSDEFFPMLRETYRNRQAEYAGYPQLIPEEGEPLKGTLFWEFSKVLYSFFDDMNPANLVFLNVVVTDLSVSVISKVLKVRETLATEV